MKKLSDEFLGGMSFAALTLFVVLLLAGVARQAVHGQEKPKPPENVTASVVGTYEPTPDELQRLQVMQWAAGQAQAAVTQASTNLQKIVASFNAEAEAIKKAHGWPADVALDPVALQKSGEIKFVLPAPKPVTPMDLSKPTGPPVEPAKKKQ